MIFTVMRIIAESHMLTLRYILGLSIVYSFIEGKNLVDTPLPGTIYIYKYIHHMYMCVCDIHHMYMCVCVCVCVCVSVWNFFCKYDDNALYAGLTITFR